MKCKKCGYEMNDDQKFCIRCGESVSEDDNGSLVHKKSKKKIIIPIVSVCVVLLIVIIAVVSNSISNNNDTYVDNDYQYNTEDETYTNESEIPTDDATESEALYNPIGKETLQYPSQDDTFTYDVYETYAVVTGSVDDNINGRIIIPDTFDNLPILAIGYQAFLNSEISEVILPSNLKAIFAYAFCQCSNLNSVEFGKNLEEIRDYAFSETNIEKISVPDSVNEIGEYCFARCDNLVEVILSDTITNIPVGLFIDDSNLKNIKFPSSLVSIDDDSFRGTGFESLILPDSVQTIGEWTFSHMNNIKEFAIPDNVSEIGDGVLANCESLEKVTVGKNIGHIPNWAFAGCAELKELIILPNVVNISDLILNENAVYNSGDLYSHPTIYGEKGSNAAAFASRRGLEFKLIKN